MIEIVINTAAVANVIREGRIDQLENIMQNGVLLGTQSMDNAFCTLLDVKLISGRDAHEACRVKSEFEFYQSASESA
jgi:twitching motility protein PilT